MSTLGYKVKLVQTGEYRAAQWPMPYTIEPKQKWSESRQIERLRVYDLTVTVHRQLNIPDLDMRLDREPRLHAAHIMDEARKGLMYDVFGEFTHPIREALLAAANHDITQCVTILQTTLACLTNAQPYEEMNRGQRQPDRRFRFPDSPIPPGGGSDFQARRIDWPFDPSR